MIFKDILSQRFKNVSNLAEDRKGHEGVSAEYQIADDIRLLIEIHRAGCIKIHKRACEMDIFKMRAAISNFHFALNARESPDGFENNPSIDQYSFAINFSISSSLSQITLKATD